MGNGLSWDLAHNERGLGDGFIDFCPAGVFSVNLQRNLLFRPGASLPGNRTPGLPRLTEPHEQDAGGGDGLHAVGGHALVVAGVRRVQVLDPQPGAVLRLADDDAPRLLHHGGIVLQPPHSGGGVSGHLAVQNGRLALDYGDVVHWLQKIQKVACRRERSQLSEGWKKGLPGAPPVTCSGGLPCSLM